MKCEICKNETPNYEVTEIEYKPYEANESYSTYDYVCPECYKKIKEFISWISKSTTK